MNKIIRYVLMCIPFAVGSLLYLFGVFNLFSSILFFCGGYVAMKNIFDYRKVNKNNNKSIRIKPEIKKDYEKDYSYRSAENIMGFKRTRRYSRVRRRVKY